VLQILFRTPVGIAVTAQAADNDYSFQCATWPSTACSILHCISCSI